MLISTEAIVLRSVRYDDSRSIVTLYTRSHGLLTFSMRQRVGASKVKGMISPLSLLVVVADIRASATIHHPKELSLAYTYHSIPFHPLKGCVLMFFNELFIKVLKEEETNPALFDFLVGILKELDHQEPLKPDFHLMSMIQLTRHLGFFPRNDLWASGMCFDLREGQFLHPPIHHNDYVDPMLSERMNELIGISFDPYQSFVANREIRNQLLDALVHFYRMHIAGFTGLKSIDVLRNLYD